MTEERLNGESTAKLQPRGFSDFQTQTRMPFICHSGLASSPAQNRGKSGQTATIKSLPQQNVATAEPRLTKTPELFSGHPRYNGQF